MVENHYRWDFIGLSTDEKPTPETSEKVTDGSTFYCSDTSKLYVFCEGEWYEKVAQGGGGGTSDFNQLSNRPKYNGTEMTNTTNIPEVPTVNDATLTITQNGTSKGTFTANDADDVTIALTDTTYTAGTGIDITNDVISVTGGGGGPTVVQTTGTSTTDVMSQNAVTSMVFADPETQYKIKIGAGTSTSEGNNAVEIGRETQATGSSSVALGNAAKANKLNAIALGAHSLAKGQESVAIGDGADTGENIKNSVALGSGSQCRYNGEVNIGSENSYQAGYNLSNYRLLTGLYDGQSAHDAATVGQITPLSDSSTPTSATVGRLGQVFIDTTNADAYMCVSVDSVTPSYIWKKISV